MAEYVRDPGDWLRRFSPDEWISVALGELRRAEAAYARGDARGGSVGLKRAAGMALNAALLVKPNPSWGRTYIEHVRAVSEDPQTPQVVRSACQTVLDSKPPSPGIVNLRTPAGDQVALEAARDVIAHAWAVVKKDE
jgi:hypothetical protein